MQASPANEHKLGTSFTNESIEGSSSLEVVSSIDIITRFYKFIRRSTTVPVASNGHKPDNTAKNS